MILNFEKQRQKLIIVFSAVLTFLQKILFESKFSFLFYKNEILSYVFCNW